MAEEETLSYDKLDDLKVADKRAVANYYEDVRKHVEAQGKTVAKATNKDLLEAFEATETDDSMYDLYMSDPDGGLVVEEPKANGVAPAAAEKKHDGPTMLIIMERQNGRYDVAGYTFTKAHPFHEVPVEAAEYIIKNHDGFRQALPSELGDYYN